MPKKQVAATPTPPAAANSDDPQSGIQPGHHWTDIPPPVDDADPSIGDDIKSSAASISSSIMRYRTINGRTYHSDRSISQYWGANDRKQQNTLDIAHHSYTIIIGNKLYLAPLPEHIDTALDIGTGTGLWAIDFADERPKTEVIGTDLSPIQPKWVPPNVSFMVDDFAEPWIFEEDSIDYVHARWLLGAVEDWDALFKSAYRVLKPGGWLESFDFNATIESDDGTLTEDMAAAQWDKIFQQGMANAGMTASFTVVTEQLQRKAMEAAGFVNIEERPFKCPLSEWSNDPVLHEVGLFSRAAMQNDIEGLVGLPASYLGWDKQQITVYASHMRRELRSLKVHFYCRCQVVFGQKPLNA